MGFLDIFKKKKDDFSYEPITDVGLGDDPFKSDPFMDPNSGLNLPSEENPINMNKNQFANKPFMQDIHNQKQNPFQKYQQEPYKQPQQTYNFQSNSQEYQQEPYKQPQQTYNFQSNSQDVQKDLQIIMAKLDTLRAEMQSISHRIENLERYQKKMW